MHTYSSSGCMHAPEGDDEVLHHLHLFLELLIFLRELLIFVRETHALRIRTCIRIRYIGVELTKRTLLHAMHRLETMWVAPLLVIGSG